MKIDVEGQYWDFTLQESAADYQLTADDRTTAAVQNFNLMKPFCFLKYQICHQTNIFTL